MKKIKIETEFIKLNQLLKWADLVDSGGHANILIKEGLIKLNGVVETRRGKKIYPGDVILIEDQEKFMVVKEG